MARKTSARVVLNRKTLAAARAGMVDGLEAVGQAVMDRTEPPDDPKTQEKIDGDFGIWVDGRKVAGGARKPRAVKIKSGITLVVGFEFPARLNELGSIHQPARPFFSPVVFEVVPETSRYMKPKVRAALAKVG